jgi:hypothetical protein
MRAAGCWRLWFWSWCCEKDCDEAEAEADTPGTTKSLAGRMGDGLCKRVADGGYRGDELLDAFDVGVLATGALGARLRLVELRLLWID